MTRESKIKEAQQESLAKFARERDLFIMNPQIKELKDALTEEIHETLMYKEYSEAAKKDAKKEMDKAATALKYYENKIKHLARSAYIAQQNGIFWTDDTFIVKKPTEPKIDTQAMFNSLTKEHQEKYITRTKKMVEQIDVLIDWDAMIKEVPIIYTVTHPIIAKKAKKGEKDHDNE